MERGDIPILRYLEGSTAQASLILSLGKPSFSSAKWMMNYAECLAHMKEGHKFRKQTVERT